MNRRKLAKLLKACSQQVEKSIAQIISLWELALKYHKKNLVLRQMIYIGAREIGAEILDLKESHVRALAGVDTNLGYMTP